MLADWLLSPLWSRCVCTSGYRLCGFWTCFPRCMEQNYQCDCYCTSLRPCCSHRYARQYWTHGALSMKTSTDLHAAPGKQNPDAHAGATGPAQFFNKQNMTHTIHVLSVLLTQLNAFGASHNPPLPNVVGIELLNEPQHNGSLERWYLDAIRSLRQIDPSIPLYIGDSWRTDQYASFIETHQSAIPFTVLDHHLYRCFTQGDASTSVSQHIQNLTNPNDGTPQMLARVSQKIQAAGGGLVVGEWSGALNPGSLHGVGNEVEMRKAYISAQLALYEEHCAGYYFWTYKKEHAGDKGWSFKDAVGAGVFPSRVGLGRNLVRDDPQRQMRRDQLCDHALGVSMFLWRFIYISFVTHLSAPQVNIRGTGRNTLVITNIGGSPRGSSRVGTITGCSSTASPRFHLLHLFQNLASRGLG